MKKQNLKEYIKSLEKENERLERYPFLVVTENHYIELKDKK